jgi:aminomethyltransferase
MIGSDLKRTPLHDVSLALGARMVDFAGYEMPVQYSSIIEEHRTVRTAVGLFDLSHMGEIAIDGSEALAFTSHAVVSDPSTLEIGQAQYSMLCTPDGGVIDDLIVYRTDAAAYLIVCNASNRDAVRTHLADLLAAGDFDASIDDRSDRTALIAPQGPRAAELVAGLTDADLEGLGNYRSIRTTVGGVDVMLARTGYTGEDGFELLCDAKRAVALWQVLFAAGQPLGLKPCGLGSRDTLRPGAGLPLAGNGRSPAGNPYEAHLGRVVKLDKGEFVGRAALARIQQEGPRRKLVGLMMRDKAVPRHGYPVLIGGQQAGQVTSGTASPTLGEMIAMAYLPAAAAKVGDEVEVLVRERRCRAEQVKLPFYRRPR